MRYAIFIQSLASVLSIRSSLGDGVNYCGANVCAHAHAHTFCRYPPGPNPSCMGYIDARLSVEDKQRVLARLNRRRSEVARGGLGLPPASDMLKLRWVEELAREAQRWADQCQPPSIPEYQDECRDLYSITVGQCVASVVGEAPGLRFETMVDMWPMQGRLYKRNIANLTLTQNDYYGDFAQMFWSRSYMVGCGRSRFMVSWYGRDRSVDRLVCNFAPRWHGLQHALWSPGEPASACPARARPDIQTPELCTFHYYLDETYDEDNTMLLEEHLLLNTILEIERNASLNYIGSIDEFYLTKLAIATIENPTLTLPSVTVNSMQKRSIFQKIDIGSKTTRLVNKSFFEVEESNITNSNSKSILEYKILKRKSGMVGRPQTYNIDDLNDSSNRKIRNYDTQETTTMERDLNYDDYEFVEMEEESTTSTTITNPLKKTLIPSTETVLSEGEEIFLNIPALTETSTSNILGSINTEEFGMFLNSMLSNLTLSQILNESAIDANVLDDYLSDPETVQQLQKALERMEKNLASSSSVTSGKVRRELRNLQVEQTVENEEENKNRKSSYNLKDGAELADSEIEKNKTIDRGPMLNMVLKYMPYLKPLEKTIMGKSNVNSATVISPSFILFCCSVILNAFILKVLC